MLETVTKEINEIISQIGSAKVSELFSQVSGGKMLRPRLMLKISSHERICELAAIVELIHIASLLHDDVIDASVLRRKKPTVNATDGDRIAVMLGDALYSKAFSKLVSFDARVAAKISSAVTTLSVGEMEDVEASKELNLNEEAYLNMLYKKTGSLIEAAAVSAAMLEGLETDGIEAYSRALGVAFQLVDDVLDIVSSEEGLGKKPFSDFTEGKTTIAYMHLYKNSSEETREFLKSIYKKRVDEEQKERLLSAFQKHGSIEYSLSLAREITEKGLAALMASNIQASIKEELAETAKKQLSRLF